MKSIIKTSALVLAFGLFTTTGVFAANKTTTIGKGIPQDSIALNSVADASVNVFIHKDAPGASSVAIYNADKVMILKDVLSTDAEVISRGYVFTSLEDGDYTIEVTSDDQVVTKTVQVFSDEDDQKMFLLN